MTDYSMKMNATQQQMAAAQICAGMAAANAPAPTPRAIESSLTDMGYALEASVQRLHAILNRMRGMQPTETSVSSSGLNSQTPPLMDIVYRQHSSAQQIGALLTELEGFV